MDVHIFTGHQGSGKTEIAVNFAIRLTQSTRLTQPFRDSFLAAQPPNSPPGRGKGWVTEYDSISTSETHPYPSQEGNSDSRPKSHNKKPTPEGLIQSSQLVWQTGQPAAVALLDIDVVNPYFAAREVRAVLEAHGVIVATPSLATTTAALPVLSGEITRCLRRNDVQAVVADAGGDPAGARILRTLQHYLHGNPLSVYCVVNTKRPSTSAYQGIIEYIDAIAAASQLPMTGLIHNTHLLDETSIEDILQGQQLLRQVSAVTKLPIVLTTVMKRLASKVQAIDNNVFTLEQYIKPPYN